MEMMGGCVMDNLDQLIDKTIKKCLLDYNLDLDTRDTEAVLDDLEVNWKRGGSSSSSSSSNSININNNNNINSNINNNSNDSRRQTMMTNSSPPNIGTTMETRHQFSDDSGSDSGVSSGGSPGLLSQHGSDVSMRSDVTRSPESSSGSETGCGRDSDGDVVMCGRFAGIVGGMSGLSDVGGEGGSDRKYRRMSPVDDGCGRSLSGQISSEEDRKCDDQADRKLITAARDLGDFGGSRSHHHIKRHTKLKSRLQQRYFESRQDSDGSSSPVGDGQYRMRDRTSSNSSSNSSNSATPPFFRRSISNMSSSSNVSDKGYCGSSSSDNNCNIGNSNIPNNSNIISNSSSSNYNISSQTLLQPHSYTAPSSETAPTSRSNQTRSSLPPMSLQQQNTERDVAVAVMSGMSGMSDRHTGSHALVGLPLADSPHLHHHQRSPAPPSTCPRAVHHSSVVVSRQSGGRSILMQQLMSPELLPGTSNTPPADANNGKGGAAVSASPRHSAASSLSHLYQECTSSMPAVSYSGDTRNSYGGINFFHPSPVDGGSQQQQHTDRPHDQHMLHHHRKGNAQGHSHIQPTPQTTDLDLHTRITNIIAEELQKQEIKHNIQNGSNSSSSTVQKKLQSPPLTSRQRKRSASKTSSSTNNNITPQNTLSSTKSNFHQTQPTLFHPAAAATSFNSTPTSRDVTPSSAQVQQQQFPEYQNSRRQVVMNPLSDEYIAYLLRTEKTAKSSHQQQSVVNNKSPPTRTSHHHQLQHPESQQSNIPRFLSPHPSLGNPGSRNSLSPNVTHLQTNRPTSARDDYPEDLSMNSRNRRSESIS